MNIIIIIINSFDEKENKSLYRSGRREIIINDGDKNN